MGDEVSIPVQKSLVFNKLSIFWFMHNSIVSLSALYGWSDGDKYIFQSGAWLFGCCGLSKESIFVCIKKSVNFFILTNWL